MTASSFAAVSQIVAVWTFAVKLDNPVTFALVELFATVAFLDNFDREIFNTVLAHCSADIGFLAKMRPETNLKLLLRLPDVKLARDKATD